MILQRALPLTDTAQNAPAARRNQTTNMTEEANYIAMVKRAKDYIGDGDIFQVVLSQRVTMPFTLPPLLYRAIRRLDPSPFLFFFNLGDFSVVGSSPEILVRVRDGEVTIRPIAGTRERGATSQDDELARIARRPQGILRTFYAARSGPQRCRPRRQNRHGQVTAHNDDRKLFACHAYRLQRRRRARPQIRALDALIGGFPAGTVSGAPKFRAMEIIDELEPERRSFYAGASAISAPTAHGYLHRATHRRYQRRQDVHTQAGAGIVYDSNFKSEARECAAKARGMIRAAEAAVEFARGK